MVSKVFFITMLFAIFSFKSIAQAKYPTPVESDFIARDFVFESGEKLAELKLHCITIGEPHKDKNGNIKNAVLIMHGTTGSSKNFITCLLYTSPSPRDR